MGDRKGKRY